MRGLDWFAITFGTVRSNRSRTAHISVSYTHLLLEFVGGESLFCATHQEHRFVPHQKRQLGALHDRTAAQRTERTPRNRLRTGQPAQTAAAPPGVRTPRNPHLSLIHILKFINVLLES